MSDTEDNIFDDEDMIELDNKDTESSSLKRKQIKLPSNQITKMTDYDEENEKEDVTMN